MFFSFFGIFSPALGIFVPWILIVRHPGILNRGKSNLDRFLMVKISTCISDGGLHAGGCLWRRATFNVWRSIFYTNQKFHEKIWPWSMQQSFILGYVVGGLSLISTVKFYHQNGWILRKSRQSQQSPTFPTEIPEPFLPPLDEPQESNEFPVNGNPMSRRSIRHVSWVIRPAKLRPHHSSLEKQVAKHQLTTMTIRL